MKTFVGIFLCLLGVTLTNSFAKPTVMLTITAEKRFLEVVWYHADFVEGRKIVITKEPPQENSRPKALAEIIPQAANGWVTTNVVYDYNLSRNVNLSTDCYGYWVASYTNEGKLNTSGCLRAFPIWMNDLKPKIEQYRMRDLFILGTHDSGAYKPYFNPGKWETLVTKYALTQDEDIYGQLMHGARYLDIRPAYYAFLPGQPFYVNHGITMQRPMLEVTAHVRKFVHSTKEFVIFGMKEFPFGFVSYKVHRKFVKFLKKEFKGLIIDPRLTWNVTLGELWKRGQYIFLAYDESKVVKQFDDTLFSSVNQRWGNVQAWVSLEKYLKGLYPKDGNNPGKKHSRPMSDMAELTGDPAGVILNKYGGLRRMADSVNSGVSKLYRDELGAMANIVALDFLRGTTIAQLAIELNKNKMTVS